MSQAKANALNDLDFAALLVSRVCHDLVSPVGAVVNGLEVLEDETDMAMRADALGSSPRPPNRPRRDCNSHESPLAPRVRPAPNSISRRSAGSCRGC